MLVQWRVQHGGVAEAEGGIEMALGCGAGAAHPVDAPVVAEPRRTAIAAAGTEHGFRAAIAIEEKMDRAWYGLGLVLVRQGRLDEAVEALRRNTKLLPMSPFGWYQLARVHVDLKQPEEARAVIRHLKGFEPKVAAQLERETGLAIGI